MTKDDPESPVFHAPKPGAANYAAKKKLYDELHGKPVIFNDEGHLIEYTDRIFLLEVKKHADNPYTSLYKGYQQNWASYKVIVMGVKCFQITLAVLATSDVLGRETLAFSQAQLLAAASALASMALFLGLSCTASPFVNPVNDKMEVISKGTLVAVPLVVLLSAIGVVGTGDTASIFGLLLNLCSAAGNVFMVFLTITAMTCFKTRLKRMQGNLAFSDPDGISQVNYCCYLSASVVFSTGVLLF